MVYCKFVLSCPVLNGYESFQWVGPDDTISGIIRRVLDELKQKFRSMRLEALSDEVERRQAGYHIHSIDISEIRQGGRRAYYICHCPAV